jgi:hypothetical protein
MGNLASCAQIYPIYTYSPSIDIKNIIVKGNNPNNKYYTNNYLREWITRHKIDINHHNWLPIGVNYTSIIETTNNGVIWQAYDIMPFFKTTNLPINAHLCHRHIINENCYILLSENQQELFGLIESKKTDSLNKFINNSIDNIDNTDELIWDDHNENLVDEKHRKYINELVEDIDDLISSQYDVLN